MHSNSEQSGGRWQLQTAKARFSELFRKARTEGPQYVTRGGKEAVVVITAETFEKLSASKPKGSLVDFLRQSPLAKVKLDLTRKPDFGRDINL